MLEKIKIKWTLENAREDYLNNKSYLSRKCSNCEFSSNYCYCRIKKNSPMFDGELKAKFCKYYQLNRNL